MGTIVLALVALLAAVIALALGLTWKGLLHWTGELLLIIGIALAAVGISDVRREWTSRPGIRGTAEKIRDRVATFLWVHWNRAVERSGWFGQRLHLRTHLTRVHDGDAAVLGEAARVTSAAPPGRPDATGGTIEDRVARLEDHDKTTWEQVESLSTWQREEARNRQAATEEEQAARMAEDRRIRERMADLAGGGLRLQAWGVAYLLAGTIMTAIW